MDEFVVSKTDLEALVMGLEAYLGEYGGQCSDAAYKDLEAVVERNKKLLDT